MAIVIGIDPGTGSSSDTGFTVFDTETQAVLYANNVSTQRRLVHHRIRDISDVIDLTLQDIEKQYADQEIIVCIESFVMRGKGGETLQRLIGSFMGRLPYKFQLVEVQNTTIKLYLAGHGHADKISVARGLATVFDNKDTVELINNLIIKEEFDIIDSLAIGVSGWHQILQERSGMALRRKPKKRKAQ